MRGHVNMEVGTRLDEVARLLEEQGANQCTVVTAQRGPLEGKRIVRGRENECAERYLASPGEDRTRSLQRDFAHSLER